MTESKVSMSEARAKTIGFFAGFIVMAFITAAIVFTDGLDMGNGRYKKAYAHITLVKSVDKNCNDCHLGESFVNLFNHPAVKHNDNTIRLMMDKAHIKQW